jgi:hypothetical protein
MEGYWDLIVAISPVKRSGGKWRWLYVAMIELVLALDISISRKQKDY